jgi:hypothetical protein
MNALAGITLAEFTKKPDAELMTSLLSRVKSSLPIKSDGGPDAYLEMDSPVIEKDYAFATCERGGVEFIRFYVLMHDTRPAGYCLAYGSLEERGVLGASLRLRVEEVWICSSLRSRGLSKVFLAPLLRLVDEKLRGAKGSSKVILEGTAASLTGNRFFETVKTALIKSTPYQIVPAWDNAYLQFAYPELNLSGMEGPG